MNVEERMSRRPALASAGTGAIGVGAVALAGCGAKGDDGSGAAQRSARSDSGHVLAKVADIPVGGSLAASLDGKPVVLAQPKPGHVVCFSAICTHQGCTVNARGEQLHCPCHGSVFQATTGDVTHGPAPSPLPPIPVRTADGSVITA
ncbi:MAG: Rieske (2Fe-2S) protein [Streptosporangiales bacterium]